MMMMKVQNCSLEVGDSAHCHSYNSNMDGFSYLGYNCSNMRNYLVGIGSMHTPVLPAHLGIKVETYSHLWCGLSLGKSSMPP